jgi:hypothetical protein
MLDTTTTQVNKQSIHISAVSGTICKTHKKSHIRHFHINSPLSRELLTDAPKAWFGACWASGEHKDEPAVVLQVMNANDG